MYTVYILQSIKTGRYYIGSTNNLERRLLEHTCNKTKSLKGKAPFKVVYTEMCPSCSAARRRELEIKSYKGGNSFKQLLETSHTSCLERPA